MSDGDRRLKAVLFDFDDTLIDWSGVRLGWREIETPRLTSVTRYLRDAVPGCELAPERLIDLYSSRTYEAWKAARVNLLAPLMPEILLSALVDLGIPRSSLDADKILKAYGWTVVPGAEVFPDVPPALETLRANGLKTGIVTNASQPMWMRDNELRVHGLLDYFPDCRLSAADVGYLKPNRRIFRAALQRLDEAAAETVFVGDNPVADIAGAQAVGMRAILRKNRERSDNGYLAKPQATISSFAEIPPLLDEWYPGWRAGEI